MAVTLLGGLVVLAIALWLTTPKPARWVARRYRRLSEGKR
jgi:hypothetical protein